MDRLRLVAFSRPSGLVAAIRNGYFAAEAIELDVTRATSSARQIRGLLAGEWDVAHTAADNVLAYVDGEDADLVVVLVAELGIAQKLVVGAGIRRIAELAGRTVGVDSERSGYALVLYGILADAGLGRNDYRVAAIGSTAERFAALAAGRIDGAMLGSTVDERAAASGFRVLVAASSVFPGYPALTVAARRSWAGANADLTRRYCRALLAGVRWAAAAGNREDVIALIAADEACDRPAAEALYERERRDREGVAPTVSESRAALGRVAAIRREITGSAVTDIARYFDPAYALAADPSLGR